MDTQGGVEDSWDFFDTQPTSPGDVPKSVQETAAKKPPTRPRSAKPVTSPKETTDKNEDNSRSDRSRERRSRSPSPGASSRSRSYSSCTDSETDAKSPVSPRGKRSRNSARSQSSSPQSRSRSRTYSRSRSRSSSYSDSETRSKARDVEDRPGNPVATAGGEHLPHRGRSRLGEDEYSSSAYSDEEDVSTSNKNNSRTDDSGGRTNGAKTKKKQAWSDEVSQEDSIKIPSTSNPRSRPRTAKGGRGHQPRKNRSRSQSEDSEALSDSDMTDVSPMDSPRNSKAKRAIPNKEPAKPQFRAMPIADNIEEEDDYDRQQQNGFDLEILMKAVGELEKQKRLQENSRRVMFAPMTLKRSEKSNYTFDKTKSRDIERENQRLLNEIVRRVNKSSSEKKKPPSQPPTYKLTTSAINREREMKRIETENMAFLRRLQKVKPTRTMSRDNQLAAYNSTTLHGVPMAALHPLPRNRPRSSASSMYRGDDSLSSVGGRTRSMTSINSSVLSSVRSGQSSRHGSRPSSATKRVDSRPAWNDRW